MCVLSTPLSDTYHSYILQLTISPYLMHIGGCCIYSTLYYYGITISEAYCRVLGPEVGGMLQGIWSRWIGGGGRHDPSKNVSYFI